MNHEFQRRAWALLIIFGSFVAAAAVWTLPDDVGAALSPAPREVQRARP
jgi:hypothetical protein